MLVFAAVVQISFLPSVLPNVLDTLNIERTLALKLAGTIVMFYTATAMIVPTSGAACQESLEFRD